MLKMQMQMKYFIKKRQIREIVTWILLIFFFQGCERGKSSQEEIKELIKSDCERLLMLQVYPKHAQRNAEYVLRRLDNQRLDRDPFLMYAFYREGENNCLLVPFMTDEDRNIEGIGVIEKHQQGASQSGTITIEERYPLFQHIEVGIQQPVHFFPRREMQQKDEGAWEKYQKTGRFTTGHYPPVYISLPDPNTTTELYVYDYDGNKSNIIPLSSYPYKNNRTGD